MRFLGLDGRRSTKCPVGHLDHTQSERSFAKRVMQLIFEALCLLLTASRFAWSTSWRKRSAGSMSTNGPGERQDCRRRRCWDKRATFNSYDVANAKLIVTLTKTTRQNCRSSSACGGRGRPKLLSIQKQKLSSILYSNTNPPKIDTDSLVMMQTRPTVLEGASSHIINII